MNRDDVIRMAREAGIDALNGLRDDNTVSIYYEAWPEQLSRFAALVAAAEREACAKVADDHERQRCEAWAKVLTTGGEVPSASLSVVAAAIRARGQA